MYCLECSTFQWQNITNQKIAQFISKFVTDLQFAYLQIRNRNNAKYFEKSNKIARTLIRRHPDKLSAVDILVSNKRSWLICFELFDVETKQHCNDT